MPTGLQSFLRKALAPFALLYGMGVWLRNRLFDWKVLPAEQYDLPVICVGNLAVGGTGKTPMTEYLIRLTRNRYRVAVLSRGYRRKSRGFQLADSDSSSNEIGDEPYQIHRKFPDILVAVDADRRRGIHNLLALPERKRPELILLDDAFQHRYVTPGLTFLLTDSHRLYTKDRLLPEGRLREPIRGAERADIIIVTKCDEGLQPIDYRLMEEELHPKPHQLLLFSQIRYGELEPLFPQEAEPIKLAKLTPENEVLLLAGIASPEPLIKEIGRYTERVTALTFPDHHDFGTRDMERITTAFRRLTDPRKIILTTEKDAARLRDNTRLPETWRRYLYYLPIQVEFRGDGEQTLQKTVFKFIESTTKKHI